MQLEQIDGFGLEIFEASIDERGEILPVVTGGIMRIETPPGPKKGRYLSRGRGATRFRRAARHNG